MSKPLVLATRRSPLALCQAKQVATCLSESFSREVELLPMVTTGDKQTDWSLEKSGGKGLFTKELELALLDGRADLAVHSAKDMPTEMPQGLELAAFLKREDPSDVLVFKKNCPELRSIASGSPRRRAQGTLMFPKAKWMELRGNVETRLQKISQGRDADASLLAAAGLNRLGIREFPGLSFRSLKLEEMVPAPGQGAIALQTRSEDTQYFNQVSDELTERAVKIERAVLVALGGGCQVALGAHYSATSDQLAFYHENCGIKSLKIAGREESDWMKEVIEWTKIN